MISIKQFLFLLYINFIKIVYLLFYKPPSTVEKKTIKLPPFGEFYSNRFKKSFSDVVDMNFNIDTVFYDKTRLKITLIDVNNELEKKWKTRILIETTPLCGNVIMYYDPFKLGFAYHSDYFVPYDVLNKIAMKYVIAYQCRDFFMDELERPVDNPSKLLNLLEEDKPKESSSKDSKSLAHLRNGPFAKLKNYNANKGETVKTNEPVKDKMRNCFIHRGKIANFSFLQKEPIKKSVIGPYDSDMTKGLFKNSNVQKEVFCYRDFKNTFSKVASGESN
jgi:hypothetical protein